MAEEYTKFIVIYNDSEKIVRIKEFEDLFDAIKIAFKNMLTFPQQFKILYEDEDMNEFVDLDSPIQLLDRKSNKVIVRSENPELKKENTERPPSR